METLASRWVRCLLQGTPGLVASRQSSLTHAPCSLTMGHEALEDSHDSKISSPPLSPSVTGWVRLLRRL